jgi:hypothetical protein
MSSSRVLIGSNIKWVHPLTSELFEGTVIRIETWFEPEKIYAPNVDAATERYLVFWDDTSPMGETRSWVYGEEQISLT